MDSLAFDPVTQRAATLRWLRPGWPLYIAAVTALGLWQGLNALINMRSIGMDHVAAWKPFLWETSSVLVILALIPAIVRIERRFRLDSRPRGRIVAIHFVSACVFSVLHTAGMVAIRKLVFVIAGEAYDFGNLLVQGFYELQKDLITYMVILLGVFAVREFRVRRAGELRASALAADLNEARLQHLTAQIEPHFLFNALNAISNRMREDVNAADRMISNLGDLLRAAYDTDNQTHVPLRRELEWLRGYAAMMGERFRGQLNFRLEVEPGIESVTVPRLLLQPLVENAFRHGLAAGHGTLIVNVERVGPRLRYTVSDDGAGLRGAQIHHGTGLSNVSRRLELLFGSEHELLLAARQPRGTMVTVTFPVSA
jgi:two-component system, LytTR family, sensor kinase